MTGAADLSARRPEPPPLPPWAEGWQADVVLADGAPGRLRPIRPDDAERLRLLHSQLSPETIYQRFHGPRPRLSDAEVARLTTVDHDERVALVALVGTEMVGVARYETLPGEDGGGPTAEVAFVIRDDQQGRGLGSVLLEHLAAAAADRGVRTFEAWVLSGNVRMLRVFSDAGYEISSDREAGQVQLRFQVTATARSRAVVLAREHAAEARSVRRLLHPRQVAVVADERDPVPAATFLGMLLEGVDDAVAGGADGPEVLAVHPTLTQFGGVPAMAGLPGRGAGGAVDLVIAAVLPDRLPDVILAAGAAGAHAVVVPTDAGAPPHEALRERARSRGLRLVGPGSAGVVERHTGLWAWSGPRLPGPGALGVFCQSAPVARAVLEHCRVRRVGVSAVVDVGDRADLSGNDLLQYFEDDASTEVVLMVLETFGNPRKFLRLCRRLARLKPVIVVRPTEDVLVDELLRDVGAITVPRLIEGLDVARLLLGGARPSHGDVQVVAGDRAVRRVAVQAATSHRLRVTDEAAPAARLLITEAPEVAPAPVGDGVPEVVVALGTVDPGWQDPHGRTTFRWADSAASALEVAVDAHRWSAAEETQPVEEDPARVAQARAWSEEQQGRLAVPADAPAAAGAPLRPGPEAVAELLTCYGIAVLPDRPVSSAEEAVEAAREIDGPVVVKTIAPGLRHRTELGVAQVGLDSPEEVAAAYLHLARRFGPDGIVLQAMAPPGVPVVLRSVEDPRLGPVLSCTVGSTGAALDLAEARRGAPLSRAAAEAFVTAPPSARLLLGVGPAGRPLAGGPRGAWDAGPGAEARADTAALVDLAVALSRLADEVPGLLTVELAPVLVHPLAEGGGTSVLSADVVLAAPGERRADSGPRRML